MEKFNQNKKFENEIQPNLPKLEQRTVTPFRGMADYVQDMAELFNQEPRAFRNFGATHARRQHIL